MTPQETRKVYIIESPSEMDILDGRKEGSALSEALSLGGIKNSYYNVTSLDTLNIAFSRIVADVNRVDNPLGVFNLHFSMHGNEYGVGLTSGEFLTWEVLYQTIKWFNDKIGYVDTAIAPGKKYGAASLNFSVCEGFNAKNISQFGLESPYTCIVGPTQQVNWSASLVAFISYYHNVIHNSITWEEAVYRMNIAAGLKDVFQLHLADGLAPHTIPKEILDQYRPKK